MNPHDQIIEIASELNLSIGEDGIITDADSITFVSMIVRLEETFDFVFPDDMLLFDIIKDINSLNTIICNILDIPVNEKTEPDISSENSAGDKMNENN